MRRHTTRPRSGHLLLTLCGWALLTAGCSFDASGLSPFGDGAVGLDGALQSDGGGACATGAQRCQGPTVQTCVGTQWVEETLCDWGCVSSPAAHCGQPRLANALDLDTDAGDEMVVFPEGTTVIDTDTGTITLPGGAPLGGVFPSRLILQQDAPPLRVLGFQGVTIPNGAVVRVQGAAALALVVREDLSIAGRLEARGATDGQPSAGGYPGGGPDEPGEGPGGGAPGGREGTMFVSRGGGGGGGLADRGGNGGAAANIGTSAAGGAGGAALAAPALASPEPLVGGAGGGGGGDGGTGGSGGGALMLVAGGAVEIQTGGVVNVGGGGGAVSNAGGGGGTGGCVLIQSRAATIAGALVANGGGGGGTGDEAAGSPGLAADTPTPGGGSHGGSGGAGALLPGTPGTQADDKGGGGGGAAGRLLVQTLVDPVIAGSAVVSPHEGTAAFSLAILPTD